MDNKVKELIKARDTSFKSGDISAYRVARTSLKSGIRSAKSKYKQQIDEDFCNNSNSLRMWQGIRLITDYKRRMTQHITSNSMLTSQRNLTASLLGLKKTIINSQFILN